MDELQKKWDAEVNAQKSERQALAVAMQRQALTWVQAWVQNRATWLDRFTREAFVENKMERVEAEGAVKELRKLATDIHIKLIHLPGSSFLDPWQVRQEQMTAAKEDARHDE